MCWEAVFDEQPPVNADMNFRFARPGRYEQVKGTLENRKGKFDHQQAEEREERELEIAIVIL